jgi:hypothetical protein
MKRFFAGLVMFGGMLAAAACDSSTPPTQPTQPTTPGSTSVTQVLTGTIAAGVTPFHSFTVPSGAPLHMMLGSLTSPAEVPLGSTVTLVYGVPATDGVTCKPLAKVSTTAGLKAQFNVLASAGEYCLAMENVGSVPEGSLYAMRVIYGTPNEDTSAGIIEYTSSVLAGGATARSFPAAVDGTAFVTMVDILKANVSALGVAVGFQRNDGSGCHVSLAYVAPRGFSASIPVDAGRYCVKVFDPGTLSEAVGFTVRIVHP